MDSYSGIPMAVASGEMAMTPRFRASATSSPYKVALGKRGSIGASCAIFLHHKVKKKVKKFLKNPLTLTLRHSLHSKVR